MMVHRLLTHYLNDGKSVDSKKYENMCKHTSKMEQKAVDAERASIKYKQTEFMTDKIGEQFDGVISGVTEWGIYVEIIENKCEGLVLLRDINEDNYIFDEKNYCIIGQHSKKIYQLGDNIKIKIYKADMTKKQLYFRFAD
jgi:ribonuclease R